MAAGHTSHSPGQLTAINVLAVRVFGSPSALLFAFMLIHLGFISSVALDLFCLMNWITSSPNWIKFFIMDSDCSSSALLTGTVCSCTCGKRMSALKFDFHTVCFDCKGVECDLKTRCFECTDVDNSHLQEYVS